MKKEIRIDVKIVNKEKNVTHYHFDYLDKYGRLRYSNNHFSLSFKGINESQTKREKPFFIRINKSFLRKNKDIIITKKFIKKIGRQNFIELLRQANIILLIDGTIKNKKQILIKEVSLIEVEVI